MGCAIIGAPWMCAAAVRSLTHLNAVTVMSTTHAPGEKPRIIEVRGTCPRMEEEKSSSFPSSIYELFPILERKMRGDEGGISVS